MSNAEEFITLSLSRMETPMKSTIIAELKDSLQTTNSMRKVLQKERKQWLIWLRTPEKIQGKKFDVSLGKFVERLHKESEVLDHMLNRIENNLVRAMYSE
jgi:hypothetical protein